MSQVVPALLRTVGTGILGDLASGTCWDVPSSPLLGTAGTGILEGLASGTCWEVPTSPSTSWDCQDWDSRESSLWDLLGCLK